MRGSWQKALRSLAVWLALGCRSTSGHPSGRSETNGAYLHDRQARRAELLGSLVNPDNHYSRLRIEKYAVDDGWDLLPEWNPPVQIFGKASDPPQPLTWRPGIDRDPAALRALGERAFFRYPTQLAGFAERVLARGANPADYGFWQDPDAGVGALVQVTLPSGRSSLAFTCATCHAAKRDGHLVAGLGNENLDLGRLAGDDAHPDPASAKAQAVAAWGPGRLDVSSSEGTEPIRFPDLRATRFQSYLQADATVAQRSLISLAIRLETLIVTSNDEVVRPPREVTLALATYLWSLGDSLPPADASANAAGAAIFERDCARCHRAPAYTGPPVGIEDVGTDPVVGRSTDRGTGTYEVPSLRGVALRRRLLHDGAFASLDALFAPGRGSDHFGHHFGLHLSEAERRALLNFIETL